VNVARGDRLAGKVALVTGFVTGAEIVVDGGMSIRCD